MTWKNVSLLTEQKRDLLLLFVVNIFFALNMNMIRSLQVLFIGSLGADALEIGLVISVQGFVSTLLMIPSGLLAERFGKKRTILASAVLAMSTPLLYASSQSWEELLPWTIAYGIVSPTFMVARMALIADYARARRNTVTHPSIRGSSESLATLYGFMNITWSIGSLLGPTIAGVLADLYGWNSLFFLSSIVSFLSIIPILFLRKPERTLEKPKTDLPREPTRTQGVLRAVLVICFISGVISIGMGVINPVMPLYLTEVFSTSKTQVGLFLSVGVGVAILLTQIPSGMTADKFGHRKVIFLSAIATPVLFLISSTVGNYFLLAGFYLLINASWSLAWPASMAYLVDAVPESKKSMAIGARMTAVRLGFTIGPLIGGYLWYLNELGSLEPTFSFYVSALFFGLSIPGALLLRNSKH